VVHTPPPLTTPLAAQGALITNLRYAEGAPGHLQGQACLFTGAYNDLENRDDARAPAPTLFEPAPTRGRYSRHRRLVRVARGRLLPRHPVVGAPRVRTRYGGSFLQPAGAMTSLLPILASGQRKQVRDDSYQNPTIADPTTSGARPDA